MASLDEAERRQLREEADAQRELRRLTRARRMEDQEMQIRQETERRMIEEQREEIMRRRQAMRDEAFRQGQREEVELQRRREDEIRREMLVEEQERKIRIEEERRMIQIQREQHLQDQKRKLEAERREAYLSEQRRREENEQRRILQEDLQKEAYLTAQRRREEVIMTEEYLRDPRLKREEEILREDFLKSQRRRVEELQREEYILHSKEREEMMYRRDYLCDEDVRKIRESERDTLDIGQGITGQGVPYHDSWMHPLETPKTHKKQSMHGALYTVDRIGDSPSEIEKEREKLNVDSDENQDEDSAGEGDTASESSMKASISENPETDRKGLKTKTSDKIRHNEAAESLASIEKEIEALDKRLLLIRREGYHKDPVDSNIRDDEKHKNAKVKTESADALLNKCQEQQTDSASLFKIRETRDSLLQRHRLEPLYPGYKTGDISRYLEHNHGNRNVLQYDDNRKLDRLPPRIEVRKELRFDDRKRYENISSQENTFPLGYRNILEKEHIPCDSRPLYGMLEGKDSARIPKAETLHAYRDMRYPITHPLHDLGYFEHTMIGSKVADERMITREMEMPFQAILFQERKRKEEIIRAQEDEIRQKELELNIRERWIKEQEELKKIEQMRDPFDELLAQRTRALKEKTEQMHAREKELKKREEALFKTAAVEIETESEKCNVKDKTKEATKIEKEETKEINIKENKSSYEQQFLYPKISVFSGEDPRPKSEATFEEWKYEVECLRKEDVHHEHVIAQAVRKSLRGQAKRVIQTLGTSAEVQEIISTLEGIFGNVASGESILQEFYTSTQKQDETVAAWGLRLEEILQKAIEKGHVKQDEKNDMLRTRFWKALRSDRLKNATRVHFESISNFELLRRAVRAEEHEMKITTGIKQQQMKVDSTNEGNKDEESKLDLLLSRLTTLEKQLKYANRSRSRRQNRNRPRNEEENQTERKDAQEDKKRSN